MREYELKKNRSPDLEKIMTECFGKAQKEANKITSSFGALTQISCQLTKGKLRVETQSDKNVSNEVAAQTIKAYNKFLELAIGYTAKERAARLRKKAQKGKL